MKKPAWKMTFSEGEERGAHTASLCPLLPSQPPPIFDQRRRFVVARFLIFLSFIATRTPARKLIKTSFRRRHGHKLCAAWIGIGMVQQQVLQKQHSFAASLSHTLTCRRKKRGRWPEFYRARDRPRGEWHIRRSFLYLTRKSWCLFQINKHRAVHTQIYRTPKLTRRRSCFTGNSAHILSCTRESVCPC